MKKHILLDALSLTGKRPKGADVYILNLLKQFSVIESDIEFTVLIRRGENVSGLPKADRIYYEEIQTGHPSLWRLVKLRMFIKKNPAHLLHLTTGEPVSGGIPIPYVMTVHESLKGYYEYSENKIPTFDLKKRLAKIVSLGLYRKMLDRAVALLAASMSTKDDLVAHYGLDGDKIRTVYYGADEIFFCEDGEKKSRLEPYILMFATGDKRENTSCKLRAFSRIKDEISHRLFIAGIPEGPFHEALEKECRGLGIMDRTKFFNFLSRDTLAPLYKNADLYIDMSFFEGFGLQALEAMAAGVPVITSNAGSLPEVVGNAGILLGPEDDAALTGAMMRILKNDEKRKEMSRASRARAGKFSWRKTAEEVLEVYQSLARDE